MNVVPESDLRSLYLDLMKRVLLGITIEDDSLASFPEFQRSVMQQTQYAGELRQTGEDWPSQAHSMIGLERMQNVQDTVERVIADNVLGDLIETGVWRGGTTIFMRAILRSYGITDRTVWVADSFEGLPPPNAEKYPADAGIDLNRYPALVVSLDEVAANFERYGLLDNQVRFLKGWFRDSLPNAPIESLAVLRLDGDLYESTMDALVNLYPKLSVGGYVIIDDYAIPACAKAVQDYRASHDVGEEITTIDRTGVYWRRENKSLAI